MEGAKLAALPGQCIVTEFVIPAEVAAAGISALNGTVVRCVSLPACVVSGFTSSSLSARRKAVALDLRSAPIELDGCLRGYTFTSLLCSVDVGLFECLACVSGVSS